MKPKLGPSRYQAPCDCTAPRPMEPDLPGPAPPCCIQIPRQPLFLTCCPGGQGWACCSGSGPTMHQNLRLEEVAPPYLRLFQSIQYNVPTVHNGTRGEEGLVKAWDSNRCSGQCD